MSPVRIALRVIAALSFAYGNAAAGAVLSDAAAAPALDTAALLKTADTQSHPATSAAIRLANATAAPATDAKPASDTTQTAKPEKAPAAKPEQTPAAKSEKPEKSEPPRPAATATTQPAAAPAPTPRWLAEEPEPPPAHATTAPTATCTNRDDLLGVSRVVEIDTATGPRFGDQFLHRGETHFLDDHEVILTFDDGPMRRYTMPILEALAEQCTKATFFAVGRMAVVDPTTLREIGARGHTIATHTWSHARLSTLDDAALRREVELGLSAVTKAYGAPVAPFFRFPYLADSKAGLAYLQSRGLGVFGIHVDSTDFRTKSPGTVVRNVMSQLAREKKGIILFHDIQPSTAGAVATMLSELKAGGYKIVHMIPKTTATTLPEFDAIAERIMKSREQAVASNPLVTRGVTWPVSKDFAKVANERERLPWAKKPDASEQPAAAAKPEHQIFTRPLGH